MKNFYCESCGNRVYFNNTVCLSCQASIAFDLESSEMVSISGERANLAYQLCRNGEEFKNCNWVVPVNSSNAYCYSCRLTEVIPDMGVPENRSSWRKIEEAKRRLVYNLDRLGLRPEEKRVDNPDGLNFRFLADTDDSGMQRVLTGHDNGIVTLNVAEADDVERERMREAMGEPYRTLVGHLRHEVGHYYWDHLVSNHHLAEFRDLFGDESEDYGEALKRYYENGPAPNWSESHISAYASAHAWEDWAETWAHYLHMMDSLGTASHSRIRIEGARPADPAFNHADLDLSSYESVIGHWPAVACLINSFNRSLGMPDAYPFHIPSVVAEKLRFIHDVLPQHRSGL